MMTFFGRVLFACALCVLWLDVAAVVAEASLSAAVGEALRKTEEARGFGRSAAALRAKAADSASGLALLLDAASTKIKESEKSAEGIQNITLKNKIAEAVRSVGVRVVEATTAAQRVRAIGEAAPSDTEDIDGRLRGVVEWAKTAKDASSDAAVLSERAGEWKRAAALWEKTLTQMTSRLSEAVDEAITSTEAARHAGKTAAEVVSGEAARAREAEQKAKEKTSTSYGAEKSLTQEKRAEHAAEGANHERNMDDGARLDEMYKLRSAPTRVRTSVPDMATEMTTEAGKVEAGSAMDAVRSDVGRSAGDMEGTSHAPRMATKVPGDTAPKLRHSELNAPAAQKAAAGVRGVVALLASERGEEQSDGADGETATYDDDIAAVENVGRALAEATSALHNSSVRASDMRLATEGARAEAEKARKAFLEAAQKAELMVAAAVDGAVKNNVYQMTEAASLADGGLLVVFQLTVFLASWCACGRSAAI